MGFDWFVLVFSAVIVAFLVLKLAPRLFPRATGASYFRRQLGLNNVDWRKLPRACLDEFVDDAFRYARSASNSATRASGRGDSFPVEYKRMMRVHASVAAALLQGMTPADIEALERKRIESLIASAVVRGRDGMAVARAEMGASLGIAALHVALARARLAPFDIDGQERVVDDTRTGKTWDVQRTILRQHGINFPGK